MCSGQAADLDQGIAEMLPDIGGSVSGHSEVTDTLQHTTTLQCPGSLQQHYKMLLQTS